MFTNIQFSHFSARTRMDRLRKSFRDSFRKKKDNLAESSKAHPWAEDEVAVRSGSCSFPVRYLGMSRNTTSA